MEPSALHGVQPLTATVKRREARSRPAKPLPTDRMKIELQLRVLQTVGRLGTDKKPISPDRLADALNKEVSPSTVALSHSFFTDCGWLARLGRGEYAAADPLIAYSRRLAAGSADTALPFLRQSAARGWFWPVIMPLVSHGPAKLAEVTVALMTAAEVGDAHRPQIKMLLDWLVLIGLVTVANDTVTLADADVPPTDVVEEEGEKNDTPGGPAGDPAGAQGRGALPGSTTVKPPQPAASPPVLSFSFHLNLTAEDLAKLSGEQIEAIYAAVGKLYAIKATGKAG
jgi:hypothetical protein